MGNSNSLFDSMVREAMDEVGKKGLKASVKAVTLAAFGMMADKVNSRINQLVKPAWVIGLSVAASAVWWIISEILGMG